MLKKQLADLIARSLKKITPLKVIIQIEAPQEKTYGDYSSNIALTMSKELKKNPRELAAEVIKKIPKNTLIEKTEIAGPGFINFWIREEGYKKALEATLKKIGKKTYGKFSFGKGKTALTDTSHPNVAKPMGVHHLLSTVIGAAINNLLENAGYTVIKDNYLGDWGTQFGKLMVAIKKWGKMDVIKKNPISELLKVYVRFHEEAEKKRELENEARAEFKKLEDGDRENRKQWEWIRKISIQEFEKLWHRLGVSFDMIHGESYYEEKMAPIIRDGRKKNIIIQGEKGALIIPMDDPGKAPAMIQKSDGATTYLTRDLARIKDWEESYHCDLGVNVVDTAQKFHFEQLFESAKKLGVQKKEHVLVEFGRMTFLEEAMSTRKGKVVLLESVLDEAEKRAYEKIQEHKSELPEEEKKELARKMGIGAIKYNILSQSRLKNYTFDWDQMLSFEGNSAPYLQYASTRTRSILKKAEIENETLGRTRMTVGQGAELEAEEKSLLKKIFDYEEVIAESLKEYKPHILCNYLFEFAQSFSHFYNNISVLDAPTEDCRIFRISLVEASGYLLKHGLEILGIEVPEKM